jgi:Trk K+ transport system NAD-binding subunit
VGIDMGPENAFEEWLSEHKIPIIFGDFHSKTLLEQAGARRARGLIFAAGDDLANLDGAIAAYDAFKTKEGPVRLIWTHIASERLADTARGVLRTEGNLGIRFFDTYRIAAAKMITKHFNNEIRHGLSEVTIIGFGKFGRDFLEILIRDLKPTDGFTIKVIDKRDRGAQVRAVAGDLGESQRVAFEQADINALNLVDEEDKAFIVCTDDDLGNLTAAMMLAAKAGSNHIYVRMTTWPLSAVAEHLGEDRGVTFVNINDLVAGGIGQLKGIFEPARPSDLKRMKRVG